MSAHQDASADVEGLPSVDLHDVHAGSETMQQLKGFDKNGDNKISGDELIDMADEIVKKELEKREMKEQRDRYRKYFGLAVVIIILLTLSTFAACWCASELSKEVHADHAALADATGTILGVSSAFASVPLYVLAAMPMEALGRVRAISVSYVDGGEQAQLQMEIVQRGKKGSTVELVDALGYTVRLEGTSAARLIVPSGAEYVVCESDASCSSVTVNNDDLQLYEAQAFELWENETAAENEAGRRLDVAERRRLAQRSLSSGPGCNGEEEEDGLTAIVAPNGGSMTYEAASNCFRENFPRQWRLSVMRCSNLGGG